MTEEPLYNERVVRCFTVMTVAWGIVGMAVGLLIAGQLAWPALNFDVPWLSYGPIDILIALVWVAFGIVFFGTIARRTVSHIFVANWFCGALIIGVAVLHIFNSLALPVSLTKSDSIYPGSVDALMQWWYGHNAVGFYLTAGFLGIMYYFVPKQAERPIYSYRLSIVHFWALIARDFGPAPEYTY